MAEPTRTTPLQFVAQALFFATAAAATGYLASRPQWVQFPSDSAQIKVSFAHGAKRKVPCRRFSAKEIAALPPSRRRPSNCPRERLPVVIELLLNDKLIYGAELPPSGIARDGPSRMYQKFVVPPGRHQITARLRDSRRPTGFDYEKTREIELSPLQNLAIDFRADQDGFIFK